MSKRSVLLILLLFGLIAISAGVAQAQAPFVNITDPTNNTVISDIGAVLNVSVNFGNAPEGGSGLLLRAWDDGEGTVFAQNATTDVSTIPWQTTLDFTGSSLTPGTHGHLTAYMTDSGGNIIATSDPIQVTYGNGAPPTATPTNPPAPTNTPTPTNTPIPSSTQVFISVPSDGATVDPTTAIPVSGGGASLNNTTVLVRLFNSSNQVMGEQSVVPNPDPDDSWALTVTKTQNVPTTSSGSLIAYAMSGNTTVAVSNAVSVLFPGGGQTQTPQPSVHISQPFNNSVVDITHLVHISGTGHNLPVAQVTVRAARSDSSVIIESTANVSGGGNWHVDIPVNVPTGTPGIIYVFARDGGNNLVAQDSINVTWGSNNIHPVIAITNPPQGAVVAINGAAIQVNGFAQGLFGNSLTVRALDTFGNVLSQQGVTTDQQGNWQAFLHVNVQPGTPGTLFAYATSQQSGAIVASASVNVFYGGQCFIQTAWPIYVVQAGDTLLKIAQKVGSTVTQLALANCINNANLVYTGQQLHVPSMPVTPLPPQVTLRVLSPLANSQLDTSQPVTVSGDGISLAGNNIVVRALDTTGNLLAQQTTVAGPADINGDSQWVTSLNIPPNVGAQGTIYVFAQSPATGAVLADALVNVSFGATAQIVVPTPAPGQKTLIITQPTSNSSVVPNGPLQVLGQVIGPIDGDVYVRVLDNQGNVIAEVQAVVGQPDAQGNSSWSATLTINVQPGTRGTIFAYVPSPFDVAAMISDAVNVIFGQASNAPFVTISSPLPYSTLDISQPIPVSGTGGALPNGTVVVRALDAQGNVLTETSTALNAGTGQWQAALQVNVAVGTRGTIVAFSTTGTSNSIVAFASLYVTFGDPTTTANFVKINAPLPGTLVDPSQTLMIAGTADRQNGNTVKVQIVDDQGNVLVEQPRNLNPAENGDFGVWQMLVELKSMAAGTHLRIIALTTSRFDGSTLATDSVDIVVGVSSQPGS